MNFACTVENMNLVLQAAYLQKGGLKTAVLERRSVLGGAAVTEEIIPGGNKIHKVSKLMKSNEMMSSSISVQQKYHITKCKDYTNFKYTRYKAHKITEPLH